MPKIQFCSFDDKKSTPCPGAGPSGQRVLCCVFGSAVLLGQGQLLVGDAGRSVRHMDDAAARKAVLDEAPLHGQVAVVGVDPHAREAALASEIQALLQKYGASKLSGIDPKHYAALLKDVEVLQDAP